MRCAYATRVELVDELDRQLQEIGHGDRTYLNIQTDQGPLVLLPLDRSQREIVGADGQGHNITVKLDPPFEITIT